MHNDALLIQKNEYFCNKNVSSKHYYSINEVIE